MVVLFVVALVVMVYRVVDFLVTAIFVASMVIKQVIVLNVRIN